MVLSSVFPLDHSAQLPTAQFPERQLSPEVRGGYQLSSYIKIRVTIKISKACLRFRGRSAAVLIILQSDLVSPASQRIRKVKEERLAQKECVS